MPSISRVANSHAAMTTGDNAGAYQEHHSGGNINWFRVTLSGIETSYNAADSNWEKTLKAMSGFGTVVHAGLPASNDAMFGLEGCATDQTAAMVTAVDAATSGSSTITNLNMSGDGWA
jgi:hypothetical protein